MCSECAFCSLFDQRVLVALEPPAISSPHADRSRLKAWFFRRKTDAEPEKKNHVAANGSSVSSGHHAQKITKKHVGTQNKPTIWLDAWKLHMKQEHCGFGTSSDVTFIRLVEVQLKQKHFKAPKKDLALSCTCLSPKREKSGLYVNETRSHRRKLLSPLRHSGALSETRASASFDRMIVLRTSHLEFILGGRRGT